jgi:hypothetical protein
MVAHRVVREAQHPVAGGGEDGLAFGVLIAQARVHLAVELDGQPTRRAAEVDDKRADWMLPAELQPAKPPVP